jgi:hypothetical protein
MPEMLTRVISAPAGIPLPWSAICRTYLLPPPGGEWPPCGFGNADVGHNAEQHQLRIRSQAGPTQGESYGEFIPRGTQEVAIVQRIDKDKGDAGIFTIRQPNTAGVSGTGVHPRLKLSRWSVMSTFSQW